MAGMNAVDLDRKPNIEFEGYENCSHENSEDQLRSERGARSFETSV